jgi:hypothetical protein
MPSETALLSVELDIIDNPSFILKVRADSDYAEYIIKDGVLYDEGLARETKMLLEKLNPGKKYYLLVSSEGFFRVTKKARKLGATQKFSSHLAAVAYFTNNSSLALLGELYNKINKPAVPTKVFSSRELAEEWLQEMRSNCVVA